MAKVTTAVRMRGREERDPEQQIEPDGRAQELREVGGHGDDFGQQPERPGQGAGELLPDHLRQAQPGGDTELGGERLHQHRHQVGGEDDPEQQIAELRAALDVGGEVAGIHVGDRGDERRTEKRQQTPQSPAARGAFQNGRGVLLGRLAGIARCGGDGGEGRVSSSVFTSGHEYRLRKDTWFIPDTTAVHRHIDHAIEHTGTTRVSLRAHRRGISVSRARLRWNGEIPRALGMTRLAPRAQPERSPPAIGQ